MPDEILSADRVPWREARDNVSREEGTHLKLQERGLSLILLHTCRLGVDHATEI